MGAFRRIGAGCSSKARASSSASERWLQSRFRKGSVVLPSCHRPEAVLPSRNREAGWSGFHGTDFSHLVSESFCFKRMWLFIDRQNQTPRRPAMAFSGSREMDRPALRPVRPDDNHLRVVVICDPIKMPSSPKLLRTVLSCRSSTVHSRGLTRSVFFETLSLEYGSRTRPYADQIMRHDVFPSSWDSLAGQLPWDRDPVLRGWVGSPNQINWSFTGDRFGLGRVNSCRSCRRTSNRRRIVFDAEDKKPSCSPRALSWMHDD